MPKPYHTVRMSRAPQMGEIFHSSTLDPAPERDKFWKVMCMPVQVVSGGYAVTLQECSPPVTKGPVGQMVHDLLRSKPPEPTLGMIYAKVAAVHDYVKHMERRVNEILSPASHRPAETLERRFHKAHMTHCFQGEYPESCAYGPNAQCPANVQPLGEIVKDLAELRHGWRPE